VSPLVTRLGLASLAGIALALVNGSAPLSLGETLAGAFGRDRLVATIVWEIRLPRALAAFGVGAALGASGAALQGLLRNPLAGPGVLGLSAFAALGAVVAIYFGLVALGAWAVPLSSILFAGAGVGLLVLAVGKAADTVRVILVGLGLSSLAGALTALALNLAPNPYSLADMVNWMLGSVANRSWLDLGLAAPGWLAGACCLVPAAGGLRALSLGEDTAASLGVSPERVALLVIMATALLAGTSVAIAGTIGFVGMVAPHVVRPLVHHDPGALLLPSALAAGLMLVLADLAIRLMPFEQELKLGVAAALIGAPAFIWIAARLSGRTS